MSFKVLVSSPYFQLVLDRYRQCLESRGIKLIVPPVKERLSEDELLRCVAEIDGVISGNDPFTERVLLAAPRLKVISKWGTGVDSIDCKAAARLKIVVRNNPNAFTEPVADTVMAYVLSLSRQIPLIDQDVRQGNWRKTFGLILGECTLGVIGVGCIGKAVVRRGRALGMRVLGCDVVKIASDFLAETSVEMVSKDELLRRCHFLSLNCDLNPTSYHLIARREFEIIKGGAYVINTARGKVIDEPSLVYALEHRLIGGAALDVFEEEPLPSNSLLRNYPNVLLGAHTANANVNAWERVHEGTVLHLLEGLGLNSQV
jgi:D-3-phosphoglycerate dehydrogenase